MNQAILDHCLCSSRCSNFLLRYNCPVVGPQCGRAVGRRPATHPSPTKSETALCFFSLPVLAKKLVAMVHKKHLDTLEKSSNSSSGANQMAVLVFIIVFILFCLPPTDVSVGFGNGRNEILLCCPRKT